jgi:hypothetical protein
VSSTAGAADLEGRRSGEESGEEAAADSSGEEASSGAYEDWRRSMVGGSRVRVSAGAGSFVFGLLMASEHERREGVGPLQTGPAIESWTSSNTDFEILELFPGKFVDAIKMLLLPSAIAHIQIFFPLRQT